jgi:hypothetical protein
MEGLAALHALDVLLKMRAGIAVILIITGYVAPTAWANDAPYDLAAVPWGTSIKDVQIRIPRLVHHAPGETIGLKDDSVVWGGVEMGGVLWFSKDKFNSINLIPKVSSPDGHGPAAAILRQKLEKLHGEPLDKESSDSGYWKAVWKTGDTKIILAYIPASASIGQHAVLVYRRSENRAEQAESLKP